MSATPITILIIGVIFSREKLTWLKIIGTILGASGAIAIILYSKGTMDLSSNTWLVNIFIILNAISYAIYFLFAKPLMKQLGMPTIFCNSLKVDRKGFISGYTLRQKNGKQKAVENLKGLAFTVHAAGDSYNDITMLKAADKAMVLGSIRLVEKTGGRSGTYRAEGGGKPQP